MYAVYNIRPSNISRISKRIKSLRATEQQRKKIAGKAIVYRTKKEYAGMRLRIY